jgi:hypothetical protein
MLKFLRPPLLHVGIGNTEEEVGPVVARLRLRSEGRPGRRIVERGGIAGIRQNGLFGSVGQRVQNLLPVAPAEFNLVIPAIPGVVLFAAIDLGVLAAGDDPVQTHALVQRIVDIRSAVGLERIRRAELRRDVLLRAGLVQAVLPVDEGRRHHVLHKQCRA